MSDAQPLPKPPAPSVADLQAEIESARQDLLATIDELKAQTKPGALADRGKRNVMGFFTDEFGGVRPERVAVVGAVVVGIVALALLRRSRR
jgi:hypothetical protein